MIHWLENLPKAWSVASIRRVATVSNSNVDKKTREGDEPVLLCNYTDVYYNEKITTALAFMKSTATRAEVGKFELRKEDVLITKDSEDWQDIAVPALVTNDMQNVLCGYHLTVLRRLSDKLSGRYLHRALQSDGVRQQFWSVASGVTRYGLSLGSIRSAKLPVPPLPTQRAIADFLDRKTAAIDALIEKKEKLLELLDEKRAALINQAVTKGLDPNVPMKDSGIPWIGEIPAHWEVVRFKRIATIRGGQVDPRESAYSGLPLYAPNHIKSGTGELSDVESANEQGATSGKYEVRAGEILYSKIRPALQKVAIAPRAGLCSADMYAICTSPAFPESYLYYSMLSDGFSVEAILASDRVAMPKVNREALNEFPMVKPPAFEAGHVASAINIKLEEVDRMRVATAHSVSLLREYRQALITAAVTGQIDVEAEEGAQRSVVSLPAVRSSKPGVRSERRNVAFERAVFAAEVARRLCKHETFGRVKFQKLLFIMECHLELDFESQYRRKAAGPLDKKLLSSIENIFFTKQGWFDVETVEGRTRYRPGPKSDTPGRYFDTYFGDVTGEFERLIKLFAGAKTEQCEIVATLYAAWNDLIIEGVDRERDLAEAILNQVLNRWNEKKRRIGVDRWHSALDWMRKKELVPKGHGQRTAVDSEVVKQLLADRH